MAARNDALAIFAAELRRAGWSDFPGTHNDELARDDKGKIYLRSNPPVGSNEVLGFVCHVPNGLSADGLADWIEAGRPDSWI